MCGTSKSGLSTFVRWIAGAHVNCERQFWKFGIWNLKKFNLRMQHLVTTTKTHHYIYLPRRPSNILPLPSFLLATLDISQPSNKTSTVQVSKLLEFFLQIYSNFSVLGEKTYELTLPRGHSTFLHPSNANINIIFVFAMSILV